MPIACGCNFIERAQKLGVKIEKYPNRAIATYGNFQVEARFVNGNIETTIRGPPNMPTIKSIIKPTSDGYTAQTIYVGDRLLGTFKYNIPYKYYCLRKEIMGMSFEECVLLVTIAAIIWSILTAPTIIIPIMFIIGLPYLIFEMCIVP